MAADLIPGADPEGSGSLARAAFPGCSARRSRSRADGGHPVHRSSAHDRPGTSRSRRSATPAPRRTAGAAILALALPWIPATADAQASKYRLDLEAGPAWQTRNTFAVPGDEGTRVALADYGSGPAISFRATFVWDAWERWSLRFLAAPLRTSTDFTSSEPIRFDDTVFANGAQLRARYTFDSYRASAFYRFSPAGRWSFRGGFTLKVRSAEIELEDSDSTARKTDLGIVPLLYGGVRFEPSQAFALDLDADALGASQGRAIDVCLRGEYRMSDTARVYLGYRILDGGADNEEVYTFATFQYAVAGVSLAF